MGFVELNRKSVRGSGLVIVSPVNKSIGLEAPSCHRSHREKPPGVSVYTGPLPDAASGSHVTYLLLGVLDPRLDRVTSQPKSGNDHESDCEKTTDDQFGSGDGALSATAQSTKQPKTAKR